MRMTSAEILSHSLMLLLPDVVILPAVAKPACAFVALHGLTDFDHPPRRWGACYASTLLMHPPTLRPLFVAASTIHFSHDVGWSASVVLHTMFLFLASTVSYDLAVRVLGLYMCVVHVPRHYHTRWRSKRWSRGLCVALVATLVAAFTDLVFRDPVALPWNEWTERLVVGHILCEETKRIG